MSPRSLASLFALGRFPRVSGDEPQIKTIIGAAKTFSPRERG